MIKSKKKYRYIHEYACPRGSFPDLWCSCVGGPIRIVVPPCPHHFEHLRQKAGRIVCTSCGAWPEVKPLPEDWTDDMQPMSRK